MNEEVLVSKQTALPRDPSWWFLLVWFTTMDPALPYIFCAYSIEMVVNAPSRSSFRIVSDQTYFAQLLFREPYLTAYDWKSFSLLHVTDILSLHLIHPKLHMKKLLLFIRHFEQTSFLRFFEVSSKTSKNPQYLVVVSSSNFIPHPQNT